jgi:uncharacterized protein YegJ (DUF2314 family)
MRPSLAILSLLLIISCSPKNPGEPSEDVMGLSVKDPRVETARLLAQDSLPRFISYFEKYGADYDYMFALKASFEQESTVEHMWAIPFSFDGKTFGCILNNVPQAVTNYSFGDTVNISGMSVEDFIIILPDSGVVGDYLTRELGKDNPQQD